MPWPFICEPYFSATMLMLVGKAESLNCAAERLRLYVGCYRPSENDRFCRVGSVLVLVTFFVPLALRV